MVLPTVSPGIALLSPRSQFWYESAIVALFDAKDPSWFEVNAVLTAEPPKTRAAVAPAAPRAMMLCLMFMENLPRDKAKRGPKRPSAGFASDSPHGPQWRPTSPVR